jgi:hypothetical protein
MPSSYLQGIQSAFDNQAQIVNDVTVVSTNWFVNRCPLITRTPRVPVGSTTFTIVSRGFRPRIATLASAASATDFLLSLVDASPFMNGDVLELASGERVEITGDPNLSNNTIPVRRSAEGTTAATGAANDTIRLISNSRTGAEINQNAVARRPLGVAQYCQTWQHPVQVGGSLQASAGYNASPGLRTPFEQSKMDALQNLMDDMEVSSYYGRGEDPATAARPKQKGLKTLLSANNTSTPTNAGAYKPTDFIRDTLEKARVGGGNPDVLLLSTNFMTGLATWGQQIMRLDAGTNVFGMKIDVFEAPFLGGITIIEAPLLKPFTAVALTSSEVRMRMKRNEYWNPRGSRGDAYEGDWMAEGAVEVDNPSHHAWLEGVTAFSAA